MIIQVNLKPIKIGNQKKNLYTWKFKSRLFKEIIHGDNL